MSKQKKHVCRKDTEEEGKKEYVTCVPDFLVPNSIPNKVQLYFLLLAIPDTAYCIFVLPPTPFLLKLV